MSDPEAAVSERRRFSTIWLVPIIAALMGVWMVVYTMQNEGPEITIVFTDGGSLEAGTTKIKYREIEIGIVDSVGLSDDFSSVVVTAKLDRDAQALLHEDTRFWVVKPRVGPGGISGLSTLLSGGYIELSPGVGPLGRTDFVGLDAPPLTPRDAPGIHIEMVADSGGSVGAGDPILYKNYKVGQVETAELDVRTRKMHFGVFIGAPYDELVTTTTRFWNASGISAAAGANGIEIRTGSIEALLTGGVALGLPEGVAPGESLEDGHVFDLYPDYASVNERPFRHGLEYVIEFDRSVRGLQAGAPVEYRGIQVGHVERILFTRDLEEEMQGESRAIPVLIRLEPGRLELGDTRQATARLDRIMDTLVGNGLRATLASGNLITGALFVSLDIYPDAEPVSQGAYHGNKILPSVASGLGQIEVQVAALLQKLNELPIEKLLGRVDRLLANVDSVVASDGVKSLPESLDATLAELRNVMSSVSADSALQERLLRTVGELDQTLRSVRRLTETLAEQPNALIFNRATGEDPRPPAGSR